MNEPVKTVSVGQTVPNFEMEIYDPKRKDFGKISLEELTKAKKWVVLLFYPADFTFVCPTELADVAAKYDAIAQSGVEIISVSTDTKFVHLAWQQNEKLLDGVKYPMGADPTGKVSRMFGVYDEGSGLSLRGTFIISPESKLVASEVNFYNVGRNADELNRKISANTYLAKHPTEACPSGWTEGKKTLTPGPSMVGKVYEALQK